MTDEMTVQTKSSVTPMVVGGVLGAGAATLATYIKPVKNFIIEPAKYSNWDAIVAEASDKDKFEATLKDSGIPSDKQTEILNKVEEARTNAQKAVDDAQKAVDDAKKDVQAKIKAVKTPISAEVVEQGVNYQEILDRGGDIYLKQREFIQENKNAENIKEFMKELQAISQLKDDEAQNKARSELEKKYSDLFGKMKEKMEITIDVKNLTEPQKESLERYQRIGVLKNDTNLSNSVTEYKQAKETLSKAVSKKENSIKTALGPYENDLAKLLKNGEMHWGKASAVIAGGVALGAIIGSFFFRPKNDIA